MATRALGAAPVLWGKQDSRPMIAAAPEPQANPVRCDGEFPPLSGVLLKQHQKRLAGFWQRSGAWASRFISMDDAQKRLCYYHSRIEQEWDDEPTRSFAVSELEEVSTLDLGKWVHAFEVRFAKPLCAACGSAHPERLVLAAPSDAERARWIDGLQARISSARGPSKKTAPPSPTRVKSRGPLY